MYDKTTSLPPADSLREALFLTIWIRRQELEVRKATLLAHGFAEMITGGGHSAKTTIESYMALVDTAFPFAAKNRGDTDKKMIEAMQKETSKGPITFAPISTPNPLVQAARKMRLPDDFRQKLQDRSRRRET